MIKRLTLISIIVLFLYSIIFAFSGTIPTGLPGHFGFGAIDKADSYAPSPPHFWKENQGTTCWDYSYQYLTRGWPSWYNSGSMNWAGRELQYWEARGQIQVFTFYYNYGDRSWYQNASNMTTYFNDFKSLCQQINLYSTRRVIIHIEPDLIGFWRQANVSPTTAGSVQVGGSNFDETCDGVSINSLPNTLQGWSEALFRIRNHYSGGKAYLAHHFTHWATGSDLLVNSHTQTQANTHIDDMCNYILNIENNRRYDLFFVDPSDRDADWYYIKQGTATRWTAATRTYTETRSWGKLAYIVNRISDNLGRRGMFWQIPVGNTYFRTCNNSNYHFRDNHAQEFLPSTSNNGSSGTPGDAYSPTSTSTGPGYWANVGIIAVLFGEGGYDENATGFSDVTHLRDWPQDGITNPSSSTAGAPGYNVWGVATSTVSDNEGGYIRAAVARYCSTGKFILPGASTPTRTHTSGPSATITPTFTITRTPTQTPFLCSQMIYDGDTAGYRLSNGTVVQPTSTVGSTAVITEVTGGNPGNGMQIVYTNPSYWQQAQWRPPSPGVNTADHTHLRFEIRAVSGTVSGLLIVLNWTIGQRNVADYILGGGGITTEWKSVVIPLADLIPGISFTEINFINNTTTNYTIMVDNIRITGGACPTSTFTSAPNTATFTMTRTSTGTPTGTNTPIVTNTFTATPSGTPTRTNTTAASPTWTPSLTATQTSTPSRTPTGTNTSVATSTWTPSRTSTPTASATLTPSLTSTPTRTNTTAATSIFTFTNTPTGTNTSVATSTWTPSRTSTPTFTLTSSPSLTSTSTRTLTPTYTNTVTFTSTFTRTISPTHSISPTITQTWTGTPPSPTNTPTITQTLTVTHTRTNTLTGTSTRTSTPTWTYTNTLVDTPTFTRTVTATPTVTWTVPQTVTPTATPTTTSTFTRTSTSTWTITLTTTPTATRTITSTITITVSLTPTVTPTAQEITDVRPYPNPVNPDKNTAGLNIGFKIAQHDINELVIRIYTSGYRLIKEVKYEDEKAEEVATRGFVNIEVKDLKSLSNGTYYFYIKTTRKGEICRSKIDKFIILR